MLSKVELRHRMLLQRDGIDSKQRSEKSRLITERVCSLPEYQEARTILLYASVRSEVETRRLTEDALSRGKKVAMPRCIPEKKALLLIPICSWRDLKRGFYGLLEPEPGQSPLNYEVVDLAVVPGVAFDEAGYRLGYGGGYYDRLLPRFSRRATTVALAFEEQIVASVPRAVHDCPVHYIVTEERLILSREHPPGVEV